MSFRSEAGAGSKTQDGRGQPSTPGVRSGRGGWRRSPTIHFLAHYVEMVLVMIAGMLVLGPPLLLLAWALGAGPSDLQRDAPLLWLLGMGFSMTVPMVWWMKRRKHSEAATREMAGAMIVPTLATVGLLVSGTVDDIDALMGIQHIAMFPSMLAVMLFRRDEYSHGIHGNHSIG